MVGMTTRSFNTLTELISSSYSNQIMLSNVTLQINT
jgi:hypothetical protein